MTYLCPRSCGWEIATTHPKGNIIAIALVVHENLNEDRNEVNRMI